MADFVKGQMDYIFFCYGLAFIILIAFIFNMLTIGFFGGHQQVPLLQSLPGSLAGLLGRGAVDEGSG